MSEVSTRAANLSVARLAGPADRAAVDAFLAERNADVVARLGELVDARVHPALIVEAGGVLEGVLTWILDGTSMEALTLHAATRWRGTGTVLIAAARGIAEAAGARRLWLITTNDNLDALRFYQRRGFRLTRVHAGAVDRARAALKPAIPAVGFFGIPLRDELELEIEIGGSTATHEPDTDALLGLERALARRDVAAIPGGYEAVLADDFIEIGASGRVWTRPETLLALAAEPTREDVEIESFELTTLADEILLATYEAVVSAADAPQTRSRRSSTWVRRDGRWQLRFNQGTPVPPDRP